MRIGAKYINNIDGEPDVLNFIGVGGLSFATGLNQSPVLLYDANAPGNGFMFEDYVTAWDYYKLSDSRFKENIIKLEHNDLSGLKQLSAVSYQLKKEKEYRGTTSQKLITKQNNTRTHFGFLAQEVKEVYPELVRTDSAGYMYIDYIGMIPLIVNALNEIQAKVDSQETVIAELQKELAALRDGTPIGGALRKSERRTVTTLPDFEYTVVTNRELAPAFDRLIGWKRQKGYSAGVVCIEDILACPDFQGGDLVSNIDDDAGKLRAYLKYTYDSGSLRYALLAGDYTVLPIRYGCGDHNYSSTKIVSNNSKIPTDIYFSDFNGNWNKDGDDHYGESTHDKVDFYPEIFVGRLLCTSRQEIANYTEKLIRYERNPGNGDYSYLQKAFYCQSDQMQRDNEAGIIKSAWGTTFYQDTVIEEFPSYETQSVTKPTGADVIREMNNRYGFFSWHGHGAPAGITVRSRGVNDWDNYAIVPFDGVLDKDSVHYSMNVEVGHGLDNLTNQDYPAIAYSIACDVTPFDIFERYDIKYNIGSSFTVAGLYGGPAFLGNTRVGWIGPSVRLEKLFVEQIKSNSYQLGVAEALSKATFNDDWCKQIHSLIGCPEFEMWTDIPSVYKGVTVWRRDNSIVVRGRLEGSKVAITSGSNGLPEVKDLTKTSVTFNGVSPNSVVTVYKHNAIPYIATLYLQNDTLRSSQYLHVNNVHIGKAVDTNRTEGDVVLKSGTLTLESGEDVWIDDGVIIENGATLIIECKGNVTISGGTVERGGTLRIDAGGEIMIQKGFEAKIGANVEFK